MKIYAEFSIPSSHICIIIAAGVLAVNVDSQRCELGPVMYKRVFTDKAFVEDAQVTKTGITTRVGCLDVCERSLAEVCTVFVFNQEQQLCKIYKKSLNQLTQVVQMGSVGFAVSAEATCPAPLSLPNGKVTYTSVVIGSTATYSCDADYHFFGLSQSSVCETTRVWNGLNGSCKQVFFYNVMPILYIPVPGLVTTGWKVEAIGTPVNEPKFSFNLMNDNNTMIALHINVRFNSNGQRNIVARDFFAGGIWKKSEIDQPYFPFTPDEQFNLTILVTDIGFNLTVNDNWQVTQKHYASPSVIKTIYIVGRTSYQSIKLFY